MGMFLIDWSICVLDLFYLCKSCSLKRVLARLWALRRRDWINVILLSKHWLSGSQSGVPRSAASTSPGDLSEMQIWRFHSSPTKSETRGEEHRYLCITKPFRHSDALWSLRISVITHAVGRKQTYLGWAATGNQSSQWAL